LVDSVQVFYRLEEGAVIAGRAKGAQSLRDDHDAFRAGPIEDIISNGVCAIAIVLDCVDSTVVLVGRQELATQGPEA
jgi:hypothetical protein